MAKTYKNIQAFLGLESLEVPTDKSVWLAEVLADTLDERIGQAISKEETLGVKMEEIVKLNSTIKELRETLAQKDAALEEKETSINELNEQIGQLNEQVNTLNSNAEESTNAVTEKENQIAQLNEEVTSLKQTITEKEAEIAKLAGKAPEVPASTKSGGEGASEEKDESLSPHNVTHAGMTLKEETEAIKARIAALNGQS